MILTFLLTGKAFHFWTLLIMVDICRRCHPQQPKLELFQPCLSPWRAMVSSKEVALAVFHCSVAKHHARFESACPRQVRN